MARARSRGRYGCGAALQPARPSVAAAVAGARLAGLPDGWRQPVGWRTPLSPSPLPFLRLRAAAADARAARGGEATAAAREDSGGRGGHKRGGGRAAVTCTFRAEQAARDGAPPRRTPRHPPSCSRYLQRGVCAPRPRWESCGGEGLQAFRLLRARGGGVPQWGGGDGSTAARSMRREYCTREPWQGLGGRCWGKRP